MWYIFLHYCLYYAVVLELKSLLFAAKYFQCSFNFSFFEPEAHQPMAEIYNLAETEPKRLSQRLLRHIKRIALKNLS